MAGKMRDFNGCFLDVEASLILKNLVFVFTSSTKVHWWKFLWKHHS